MKAILEGYEVVLLDMHRTFMFGTDRFSDTENYASIYRSLGGSTLLDEEVNSVINNSRTLMMHDYSDPINYESFPQLADKFVEQSVPESEFEILTEVFAAYERGTVPTEYADCLRKLAADFRLGVVSNIFAPKCYWIPELKRAGVLELFEVFIASSDYSFIKPSPLIFEEALNKFRIAADRVVHIGDSYKCDVEGATNAGIDAVWINSGIHRATEPAMLATHILPDLTALRVQC